MHVKITFMRNKKCPEPRKYLGEHPIAYVLLYEPGRYVYNYKVNREDATPAPNLDGYPAEPLFQVQLLTIYILSN